MTAMTKFAIGGAITVVGLVLMTLANRQMIQEAECVDCQDEDTTGSFGLIDKVSEASAEIVEEAEND